jgi:hypothetical protein
VRCEGTHANVEHIVRDYLAREWAARRGVSIEDGIALFGTHGAHAHSLRCVACCACAYVCGD